MTSSGGGHVTSAVGSGALDASIGDTDFCRYVAEAFSLSSVPRTEDRLADDLGFDSVAVLELVLVVEELAGAARGGGEGGAPSEEFPALETVADAYALFRERSARGVPVPGTTVRTAGVVGGWGR